MGWKDLPHWFRGVVIFALVFIAIIGPFLFGIDFIYLVIIIVLAILVWNIGKKVKIWFSSWRNLPHWLKGGIIGGIVSLAISIILVILMFICGFSGGGLGCLAFLYPLMFIYLQISSISDDNLYFMILGAIVNLVVGFIVGAIIGLVIGKIKLRKQKGIRQNG